VRDEGGGPDQLCLVSCKPMTTPYSQLRAVSGTHVSIDY